jgi:RNA polymerase sigma factor (sigma-70 family)
MVAELAGTHRERLRRFLIRRVRNAADVPDIVQEVFLRMLRIPNHEAVRSPEAYLFTVALHVAQQHALREAAMPASIELAGMLTELHATDDADPVMQASAEQFVEEIESSLDKMSPKVRAVFILHRRQGLSLEEIAAHLGISFPMAKKYLVKALFQLRGHMDKRR